MSLECVHTLSGYSNMADGQ